MDLRFEWDDEKANRNRKTHGVTFEEAATVFGDPLAAIFADARHSAEEEREIIVGHSERNRLLLICLPSVQERSGSSRTSRHQTRAKGL